MMTQDKRSFPHRMGGSNSFLEADPLLRIFAHRSIMGFGLCDLELRYLSVNEALADSNGVRAAAHIGNTLRDILGNVAESIEPALCHVHATGQVVLKEVEGTLPRQKSASHWVAAYFPLAGAANKIQRLGAMVVDVTDMKALEKSLFRLDRNLGQRSKRHSFWARLRLRRAIDHYFVALSKNLGQLPRQLSRLDRSADEQSALLVESLDHRIATMRDRICALAARLSNLNGEDLSKS